MSSSLTLVWRSCTVLIYKAHGERGEKIQIIKVLWNPVRVLTTSWSPSWLPLLWEIPAGYYFVLRACVHAMSLQSCLTFCDPTDHRLARSSVHGVLQARILEWAILPSSRGSSPPRNKIHISCLLHWQVGSSRLAPPGKPILRVPVIKKDKPENSDTEQIQKLSFIHQRISHYTIVVVTDRKSWREKLLSPPVVKQILMGARFVFTTGKEPHHHRITN